jgi:hypothetical protein
MGLERRRLRSAPALALALLAAAGPAFAEGGTGSIGPEAPSWTPPMASALPAEAPASLFSAKLGKGAGYDAELYVSGSWSATAIGSLSLQKSPGSGLGLSQAQPLLFSQAPDLTLSFLLYKKLFVEASVADDLAKASYAVGYRGDESDALKEFRAGNKGISFPALPFISFGPGSYRSFGAAATIGSSSGPGPFTGRAMVRYDQADRVVRRYVGGSEVSDLTIAPNAFVSAKYFLVRASGPGLPAANLALFVQSSSGSIPGGDGFPYRRLADSEFSYSAATGLVALASPAATRVLAYYADPGGLQASGGGSDAVSLPGVGGCDLLYVPPPDPSTGSLDPKLQVLSRYATTASASSAEAFVLNPASGARDTAFEARIDAAGFIEVTRAGSAGPSGGVADREAYRRPFDSSSTADSAWRMPWIYTTDFAQTAVQVASPIFTRTIVVRSFSSSGDITLDKDVVAGSIELSRDGVPDYSFAFDPDTGKLALASPPGPSEELVVSYMKESAERRTGNLAAALGGFWDLGESRSAWAALGVSWAVPGTSYSAGSGTEPGSIALTLGEADGEGAFRHDAAVAARYSRDDATGRYRIEGMESGDAYSTTFRPVDDTSPYASAESPEGGLAGPFPTLVSKLHADGSTQRALSITATSSAPIVDAVFSKIEATPPYSSFTSFSFYANIPPNVSLVVRLDDGSSAVSSAAAAAAPSGASVLVSIPSGEGAGTWRRYSVSYGSGDAAVYAQDSESSKSRLVPGATATLPGQLSVGSRLVIAASGLGSSSGPLLVDELLLEDSVGRIAALFQGKLSYDAPEFRVGGDKLALLSGLSIAADAQAAAADSSYASTGASVATATPLASLALKGRALLRNGAAPAFRGGHSLSFPAGDSPLKAVDEFSVDPATGSFARSDKVDAQAGNVASLGLAQASAWVPASTAIDEGLLTQSWDGTLGLGGAFASLALSARNRVRPSSALDAGGSGKGYFGYWIGAFEYAIPVLEAQADLREVNASLSAKGLGSKEFFLLSLAESAQPRAASGSLRLETAKARLGLPLEFSAFAIEPYYSRSWSCQRAGDGGSLAGDAVAALEGFRDTPLLYASVPFAEFFSSGPAGAFAAQSAPGGLPLATALYEPETGIGVSRQYGSSVYDLAIPSALSIAYKRSLMRAADAVTDTDNWTVSSKWAALNVFGAMGIKPLGLPFDSDEYLSTIQGTLASPRGGGGSSLDLQYRGLATLYAGAADRMDADAKVSVSDKPDARSWSCALALSLSRRVERQWLLDLYGLVAGRAGPEGAAGSGGSVASLYFRDLAGRRPTARNSFSLKGGLAGIESDKLPFSFGWNLGESYEAKLTIPERLTIRANADLSQGIDASSRVLSIGLTLSLNAVISF